MSDPSSAMAYTPTAIKNVIPADNDFDITSVCELCGHLSVHPGTEITSLKLKLKDGTIVDMTTLIGTYEGAEWLSKKVVHPITKKVISGFFSEITVSSGNVVLFV